MPLVRALDLCGAIRHNRRIGRGRLADNGASDTQEDARSSVRAPGTNIGAALGAAKINHFSAGVFVADGRKGSGPFIAPGKSANR